jgi:hypothetical protein
MDRVRKPNISERLSIYDNYIYLFIQFQWTNEPLESGMKNLVGLLEKLPVLQLLKYFPAFYGT